MRVTPLDPHALQLPFTHLTLAAQCDVADWSFIVLVHGDHIAVVEKPPPAVVLDEPVPHGPAEFERLIQLTDEQLLAWINTHPHARRNYLSAAALQALKGPP